MRYRSTTFFLLSIWGGAVASCDVIQNADEQTASEFLPLKELPWPEPVSLPACEPMGPVTAPSRVALPSGFVDIDMSADYLPLGVDEAVEITVRDPATGERDTAASGTVILLSDNIAPVEAVSLEGGKGHHLVRFDKAGNAVLTATFTGGDGSKRSGTLEVVVYETKLPIYELDISEDDLAILMASPDERIKRPCHLVVDGISYESEVRLHGASSRSYPKKSFRFDLADGLELPDTHDHIILRAEWNDKSLLRDYLGLEVFRNGTWLPTPTAEMVHFRVNHRYYGVMWRVERIGGDFLRLRGMNKDTCSLYEADPDSSCWNPGGDLTPLTDMSAYYCVYDNKKGPLEYDDLKDFIENTLQLDDAAFGETIESVLDVDAYLTYLATMAIIGNADHIKKNYYMYRDPDSDDDRWIFLPWDLELTFGHMWTEENDVLDENIFTDSSPEFVDFRNRLIEKLFVHPRFLVRYYDLIAYILDRTFTPEFVQSRIDWVLCMGMPDIWADTRKRASDDEYLDRILELYTYVDGRRAFLSE